MQLTGTLVLRSSRGDRIQAHNCWVVGSSPDPGTARVLTEVNARQVSWRVLVTCSGQRYLSAASGHLTEDHPHRGEQHDQDSLRADGSRRVAALSRVPPGEAHFGLGGGAGANSWALMAKEACELANGRVVSAASRRQAGGWVQPPRR